MMAAQPDTKPLCPPSLWRARPLSALSLGPPLHRPPTNSCGAWTACVVWLGVAGQPGEQCSGDLWLERQLVEQSEEAREITAELRPGAGSREGRSVWPSTVCYFSNLVHDAK